MRRRRQPNSHDGHFGFCPAKSQLYRVVVKPPRRKAWDCAIACSWQTAGDRLIDGPRPEDGTDFSSHAAGASPGIPEHDCRRVVVAGHADHAGARADRSRGQAAMRVLRAVPRRPDAAGADHAHPARTDRPGPGATRQNLRLRPHLFDRERPRPGSGARRQGRAQGHPGHLARQQPAEEPRPDFDRGRPDQGISRRHHRRSWSATRCCCAAK